MEEINLLIAKSNYEEALKLIDKTISEKPSKNEKNALLLNKAHVLMQLELFSGNLNEDVFHQASGILSQIDESKEEISIKKKILMLKYYNYPKNNKKRSEIFDQLEKIDFNRFPKLKSNYLREKALDLEKYFVTEDLISDASYINDKLNLFIESLEISEAQNQMNEYVETLLVFSQKLFEAVIRFDFVNYQIIDQLEGFFIHCENKNIEVRILTSIAWVYLSLNEINKCISTLDKLKLILDN